MHFFVLGSFRFLLHQEKIKGTKGNTIKILKERKFYTKKLHILLMGILHQPLANITQIV